MIRRDETTEEGKPQWILFTQVAHAHLAFEIAKVWGRGEVKGVEPREELLQAVKHHDDGWTAWEQAPQVDQVTGQPLDFTELELEPALNIWRGSIEESRQFGPLAGSVVSQHFMHLLGVRNLRVAERSIAQAFEAEQQAKQQEWLKDWQAINPSENRPEVVRRGLRHLQMFDWFSLWLLMRPPQPYVARTPEEVEVTWNPITPFEITLSPWPLAVDRLTLRMAGRVVPRQAFPNAKALAEVPLVQRFLEFTLHPA